MQEIKKSDEDPCTPRLIPSIGPCNDVEYLAKICKKTDGLPIKSSQYRYWKLTVTGIEWVRSFEPKM